MGKTISYSIKYAHIKLLADYAEVANLATQILQILAFALIHRSGGDHPQQLRPVLLHLRKEQHGHLSQCDDWVRSS